MRRSARRLAGDERSGGDDGARTRDLRRDRTEAKSAVRINLLQFRLIARIAWWPFLRCYSRCYSSRRSIYARCGIEWAVPEKPVQPRKLVWLVVLLDRLSNFPPLVRQKPGFALDQAQVGQQHERAKIVRGFAETV